MTSDQFNLVYRAFCRRRPFREFFIEFTSGVASRVPHPEAVRPEGELYALRLPDGANVVFAAESVTRMFDVPAESSKGL